MTSDRAGKLPLVTMTEPSTFLVLALHGLSTDEDCQRPKIDRSTALAELTRDVERAELRLLMEER